MANQDTETAPVLTLNAMVEKALSPILSDLKAHCRTELSERSLTAVRKSIADTLSHAGVPELLLTVEMAEAMREKWQADVTKAEAERDALNAALVEQTEKLAAQTLTVEMAEAKRIEVTAERDAAVAAKEAAYAEGVEAAAKLADDFDYEPYRRYDLAWAAVCDASETIGRQIRALPGAKGGEE